MVTHNLLWKTELRIHDISLQGADLSDIAGVVADVLGMQREEVLVTDVQDGIMALDILKQTADPRNIVGKKKELLKRLGNVPGVAVSEKTSLRSEGMLGWIVQDKMEAKAGLTRSEEIMDEIHRKMVKRVIVFSTGSEVANGQVKDTNTSAIAERLRAEGYTVIEGPTLGDDVELISGTIRRAVCHEGVGLVITTGGVGAEAKDCTVEAILAIDPNAATPYICTFEKGKGRHHKDGVKIGVGQMADAFIVALPGPNDEVRASLGILIEGLRSGEDKYDLAEELARNLREKLREKMAPRQTIQHKEL